MKRFLICFLIFTSAVCQLFSSNLQKTYTVNDEIYKRVDRLCRSAGVTGPTRITPVNAAGLVLALERIPYASLNAAETNEYNYLKNELTNSDYILTSGAFALEIDMDINLEINIADYDAFIFTNENSAQPEHDRREDVLVPYRFEKPFFSIKPVILFGDKVVLNADFYIKNKKNKLYESSVGWLLTGTADGEMAFFQGMSVEFPYRAGLSSGNEWFNFMLGRFPHSIGAGITGNLVVGDNFIYQELAKLSFTSNLFSYDISVTRFDQQIINEKGSTSFSKNEFSGMQQYRVVHRFDLNLFNKVRFALNLGTLYNGNAFDFRFFYPFVIGHNYFNYTNEIEKAYYDEGNNILGIEAEFMLHKGLNLYIEFVVDQFQMYWEPNADLPPAFGGLLNLKYSKITNSGTFNFYFEGVYTNPYLYLNRKEDAKNNIDYNLDYVVGYYMQYLDDYGYSGYVYGPDSIVFALGFDYISPADVYKIGINAMYRVKGKKGIKHKANSEYSEIDMSNALIEQDSSIFLNNFTPTGGWENAEHLIKLCMHASFKTEYGFEIYSIIGSDIYINYEQSNKKCFLPQLSFGVTWSM